MLASMVTANPTRIAMNCASVTGYFFDYNVATDSAVG
jgi:hypothetical protein